MTDDGQDRRQRLNREAPEQWEGKAEFWDLRKGDSNPLI